MLLTKDNLIPEPLLNDCLDWLNQANWKFGWKSHANKEYSHWNVDISRTGRNHADDISDKIPEQFQKVWVHLNKEMFGGKGILVRCYSNRHTFGVEGTIHTDTERDGDYTCVIYLNKKWPAAWGGETAFYSYDESEIIGAVIPKFGRVSMFAGNIPHCARALSKFCPEVRTTLMYKVMLDPQAYDKVEATLRKFLIDIGAHTKKHKFGTLMDHLISCYKTLKAAGCGDVLALTGGLHSVFGTNAFKDKCLNWESPAIQQIFGDEVDRLVRMFSTINRPSVLENPDGSLDEKDLFLMRCIEAVNLYDQNELNEDRYPNLVAFAKQFG